VCRTELSSIAQKLPCCDPITRLAAVAAMPGWLQKEWLASCVYCFLRPSVRCPEWRFIEPFSRASSSSERERVN